MRILSIYPGHNACLCILDNGKVIINWELERFTRIKHDYGFRHDFLVRSLELAGLTISDIDFICMNRGLVDSGVFRQGTILRPFDIPATTEELVVPFTAELLGKPFDALAINHHLAHAACAFFTSPFEEAAIFTYDGYGDAENASWGFARRNRIIQFDRTHLSDIAGWWVSLTFNNYRMVRVHEWDPGSHAGKIMALAAYGHADPQIIRILQEDMTKAIRRNDYPDPRSYAFNNAEDLSDTRAARSQNLAHAIQQLTEDAVRYQFSCVRQRYPAMQNLCYAGGLALNCIANSRALTVGTFERLYVPPCPNDAGLALGMALYTHHQYFDQPRRIDHFMPYTGPTYAGSEAVFCDLARRQNLKAESKSQERLVEVLCRRDLVCFYGPRSECGPRALGSRSILCLPDRQGCADFVNSEVKHREWYRPYGPIILSEVASEVLEEWSPDSAYMTTSARIRQNWRVKLRAVDHVDNTTRPQILRREQNPFLFDLLQEVYKRTGIPALLNTSFNLHEPIVETPHDAWRTFLKLPISYLVTENHIFTKR